MLHARATVSVLFVATVAFQPLAVHGQEKYPGKLIRIVTAAPGSNHDWGARLTAQELAPRIGQRVIVENRGSVAVEHVAKDAAADGYTVLFYGAYAWLQPLLQKVRWDPLADLAPVTLAMSSPNVLAVHPSLPVKTVKQLIALAKAKPGELNYSAGGGGSTPHVAAELFKYMAGVNIVRVHYKGSGPSMIGLMVGEAHLMFAALGPVLPLVQQGRVRAIAVSTPRRTLLMPELPPVADTLPGFTAEATIGFFVPRNTPPAVIAFLNREIVQALKTVEPKRLTAAGIEIVAGSPEEFAVFIRAEMARMGKVFKSASFSS